MKIRTDRFITAIAVLPKLVLQIIPDYITKRRPKRRQIISLMSIKHESAGDTPHGVATQAANYLEEAQPTKSMHATLTTAKIRKTGSSALKLVLQIIPANEACHHLLCQLAHPRTNSARCTNRGAH
jgi:hypothetical protein